MLNRSVAELAHIKERDLIAVRAGNRKPDSIPIPLLRQARTAAGIPQIAEFADFGIERRNGYARSAAFATPASSERQTRRMQPGTIV